MRNYELMFIVDPPIDEGSDEIKLKIEGIITGREGAIESFTKLGKKRLAYPIEKRHYGVYYLVNFRGDGRIVQALDYYLRLNPAALRHIIIALSDKELGLRQLTERVQEEEAERMRLGGKPLQSIQEETSDGEDVTDDENSKPQDDEALPAESNDEINKGTDSVGEDVLTNEGDINKEQNVE